MRRISHSLLLIALGAAPVLHGQQSDAERAPRHLRSRVNDEEPEDAPVFERFRNAWVLENGEVWIEIFYEDPELARDSRRPVFILDRSGNVVGMVRLPERTRLEKGGSDYLLGVERDQDDRDLL